MHRQTQWKLRHAWHAGVIILLGIGFGAGILQLFSASGSATLAPRIFSSTAFDFSIPKEGKAIKIDFESKTVFLYRNGAIEQSFPIAASPATSSPWYVKSGTYEIEAKEIGHQSPVARVPFYFTVSLGGNAMVHELSTSTNSGGIALAHEYATAFFAFGDIKTPVFVLSEGPLEHFAFDNPTRELGTLLAPLVLNKRMIGADAFVIGDLDTGEILLERNKDRVAPIASVSKLFTALVALDVASATATPRSKAYKLEYPELLYPMLMESDNEAANEIARIPGRASFMAAMNAKAGELGLTKTAFKDPSGLSPGNRSTAADLFSLARYLYEQKHEILEITRSKGYGRWTNLNRLVRISDTTYLGGKTGYIPESKQTWVALFSFPTSEFGRKNVAVVVLGSSDRYTDVGQVTKTVAKGLYGSAGISGAFVHDSDEPVPTKQRLLFVGDIMLDRGVKKKVKNEGRGDYSFMFEHAYFLKEADLAFANLEGPVSDKGYDLRNLYSFRMEPETLLAMRTAGIDVVSIANNHIGDWGRAAFEDTLTRAADAGIVAIGGGINAADAERVRIIDKNGVKIGFLGFSDVGPEWMSEPTNLPVVLLAHHPDYVNIIARAKASVDLLVVSLHFGEEYAKLPSSRQKDLARRAVDAGADIIVGHHPHVRQPLERYKEGVIAYSLGNFIFDQSFSEETTEGGMLEVTIDGKKIVEAALHTTNQNENFQPVLDDEFEF